MAFRDGYSTWDLTSSFPSFSHLAPGLVSLECFWQEYLGGTSKVGRRSQEKTAPPPGITLPPAPPAAPSPRANNLSPHPISSPSQSPSPSPGMNLQECFSLVFSCSLDALTMTSLKAFPSSHRASVGKWEDGDGGWSEGDLEGNPVHSPHPWQ